MSVHFYHELTPRVQELVLDNLILGDLFVSFKPALHQLLMMGDYLIDTKTNVLHVQSLPCSFETYQQEQKEIETGRWR